MPSETLARIKARQDSLSRMQGVPLGLKPLQQRRSVVADWIEGLELIVVVFSSNLAEAEESILSRCRLLSAEAFARIR